MLSPDEAHHLRRLISGDRPPDHGMERHFLRVIQGEASPLTEKEREWFEFWEAGASDTARPVDYQSKYEETLQILHMREQLIQGLNGIVDRLTVEKAKLAMVVREKAVSFHQQAEEIERLRGWLKNAHAALRKYEPPVRPSTPEATEPADKTWAFCHSCGGDGGPGGRCLRCGGNGFEPT